jgi:hypothetical protein
MNVAVAAIPSESSGSAAIERLLARYMRFVPVLFRPLVMSSAREMLLLPPATFSKRLREKGFDLEPGDALDVWAAILWSLGDE